MCERHPDPAEQIIGTWQSELSGFEVVSAYTNSTVAVDNNEPLSYTLIDGQLVVGGDKTITRLVSFASGGDMIQIGPMTQSERRFIRVAE